MYAPIWPKQGNNGLHNPYGEYSRWLIPGATEVCRVIDKGEFDANGNPIDNVHPDAENVWIGGGIPIMNEYLVDAEMMNIHVQYVDSNGISLSIRKDCRVPGQQ